MAAKLAILAGGGPLPARLAQAAQGAGRAVAMVAFEGHTDPAATDGLPHLWTRFGAVADIFTFLRREGVSELVFAGPVRRPAFAEIMPDWQGTKILAR
ncbi:MAG: LpxI family protein, partial [Rhodospirillaceae bacterium]